MAHRLLRRDGHQLNHKRIRRLWREEGLRRPVTCRKRRRVRPDTGGGDRDNDRPGVYVPSGRAARLEGGE